MNPVLNMLKNGNRHSTGNSDEVVAMVLDKPELFDTLFAGLLADDPLIRLRSADAAEKVTAIHPKYLTPYKTLLLRSLAGIEQAEMRWHVAPMLARLHLSITEQTAVVSILNSYMNDHSSVVKISAMQALYDLSERYETWQPVALSRIEESIASGTPAVRERGNHLLAKMNQLPN